ncbi:phosphate ABC transporter substrate-binding protein (PhoT family) [Solirubrobacter pauli]|uniref:Phosphate-binding protein n=1 Tax=Solirubrobacter pauli TaxID=166793 RepID=A0A660LEE8_9ACTN|nr:phosphate ABC transporter substrate-binding protein PstS [Solirubrobacter pauli]RKQ91121.1 phosphate ABC transporter substrate-binding protein (PhoT family) [Solirubrobacter pauli]
MGTTRFKPVAMAAAVALAFGATACGAANEEPAQSGSNNANAAAATPAAAELSGNLAGAGASSQEAAQQAWIAGFQEANPDTTISYDAVGSGGGREQFIAGGVAFAGTDSHVKDEELTGAQERCGGPDNLIEIPAYISPIAVIYNLDGVENLQLSPETLAKIFKQEIKTWDDAAIKADNPDATLPSERITVVNRSDESGTTENFQEYLAAVAPDVWDFEVSGDWPVKGGEAAQGTSGVVDAVKAGKGAIGYADASQAGELGKASVKVGEEFVAPTPEAAAKIVEASEETDDPGAHVFTYDLKRDTTEAGTYPIVLVSYLLACTKYDDAAQGALVKGYVNYIVSAEGQQAAATNAGSAPISEAVRAKVQPAVDAIAAN